MTSAVKVEGERLYRRAHRGESVETPEREVEVYRAELLRRADDSAEFEIECSTGTYVRTLLETLGDAYCERLRRTAIGPFRVEAATGEPLSVEAALGFLPERILDARRGKARPPTGSRLPPQARPPGRSGSPTRGVSLSSPGVAGARIDRRPRCSA